VPDEFNPYFIIFFFLIYILMLLYLCLGLQSGLLTTGPEKSTASFFRIEG
jgi:hypothetical protein